MRTARSTIVLLALLFANAAAILFFRFFITVDGPVHVLHASLLEAPWTTPDHLSHGITYNSDGLHGWLGDRVLMVLLLFLAPEQAHDLFAALVSCAVVLSVIAFLRAHGTRMGPAILWLAPIMFNVVLIMGLFHFLLGIAVAFGSVAWWRWRATFPRSRWTGLLVGVVLAWFTHRSGPIVLCLIFLPMFLVELIKERTTIARGERRFIAGIAFAGMLLVVGMLQLGRVVQGIPLPDPRDLPAFNEAFLLRPLIVLDLGKEQWLARGIGALLVISTAAGVRTRWRMGWNLFWHDMFLVLFLFLTLVSWLYHAPRSHQLLIAERGQWLALLSVAIWLVAIADAQRGKVALVIGWAALCALPFHFIRIVQAEKSLSRLQQAHDSAMEACHALAPGSLVVAVIAEPDWLLQHLEAYVAIGHDGILLAPKELLSLVDPSTRWSDPRWLRMAHDPSWPARHWRAGIPPEVDQILFIGSGIERAISAHPWPGLLAERYRGTFDNGYARIYTVVPDSAR